MATTPVASGRNSSASIASEQLETDIDDGQETTSKLLAGTESI